MALTELGALVRNKLQAITRHLGIEHILDGPVPITPTNQSSAPFKSTSAKAVTAEFDPVQARILIDKALAEIPEIGELILPDNVSALATLLSPAAKLNDLSALDLLYSITPANTRQSNNRVLVAIAQAMSARFGQDNRLPLTTLRVWGMLNAETFTDEFAKQFSTTSTFILNWHIDHDDFLHLDPSEMALLEFMFESLHPRKQGVLAAKVMDFRVLGNRRMGLLRRMPNRIENMFRNTAGDPQEIIQYSKDCLALLDHIARPGAFAPIIEEAKVSAAKIVKTIQRVAGPPPELAAPPTQAQLPPPTDAPPSAVPAPPAPAANAMVATPPKRLTKRHRTEAALRYLRGEPPEAIGKSLGVNASAVEGWVESFISGGTAVLAYRDKDDPHHGEQSDIEILKSQVEYLTKMVETLAQETKTPLLDFPKTPIHRQTGGRSPPKKYLMK